MELADPGVALLVIEQCKARFFYIVMFNYIMYSRFKIKSIILCEVRE